MTASFRVRTQSLHGLKWALACGSLLTAAGLSAQTLSSPLASGGKPVAAGPAFDVPVGQGAGVHGANSPFPPLSARSDVVPWSVLTAVKTKNDKNRILPVFNLEQMALNQKTQRIQGFMMPLDPGEKQKHFLLSSVPLTCAFCLPGGPESMVEVKTKTPVKYSMEPVVVEGRFLVLNDDSYGLYYRITDATGVK
ncbi:MAG: DUF3299 domain-containing protein [Polaromonas sp.]|uniref:DUF3299 domain-containing protein n=1 Tax=Polaromonas sp. TaxID=1869339 RepID=UPI003267C7D9